MSLSDKLKAKGAKPFNKGRTTPLWEGPEVDTPNGGISFSMLSRYLVCPERFRINNVEGLRPIERFDAKMEFGNMWHAAEESLAANPDKGWEVSAPWNHEMLNCARELCMRFDMQQEDINHWYRVCSTLFPLYQQHWAEHPDVTHRLPVYQEKVFGVWLTLPSGRKVFVRGKWDALDFINDPGMTPGLYLQENKTKSRIDSDQVARQLKYDLQTMLYLITVGEHKKIELKQVAKGKTKVPRGLGERLAGVRYNVIKRPGHYQGKKETPDEFQERLAGIVQKDPGEFFARWKVEVSQADINKFTLQTLYPVLENLCDDYEWWAWCKENDANQFDYTARQAAFTDHCPRHYVRPFGLYDVLAEGGATDMDEYLRTGSTVGLTRDVKLFPELETTCPA